MKTFKKYGILVLILLIGIQFSSAQSWHYFSGHVIDDVELSPVVNYPVYIQGNDTILKVAYTNDSGYFIDSVYADPASFNFAVVFVDDCLGEIEYVFFEPPGLQNIANFEICVMPYDCYAIFYYDYAFDNEFIVNFFDLSTGGINKWEWDFGDSNVSDEINPSHEYAEPGLYQVVLIVEDTLGVCWSAYSEFVRVGEINDCEAYFEYVADGLSVHFDDLSMGNIQLWEWDFGDGNWSVEQNPSHTFSQPGVYDVCLTVTDSMFTCFDTYCTLVFVGDTLSCEANFEVVLDTLNPIPHTFVFTDNSSGDISSWLWDFGDGGFSQEQNPVHTYLDGGNFNVCLTILSNPVGDIQCSDELCIDISTLQYYNFGGHAFIDGFPINVEENDSSNIATALLFRRFNNQWKFMDSRDFWRFGYYWFVEKPEGEYLIRIDLDESSVDYESYAPSYYANSTDWRYAATVNLSSDDQFSIDVNFKGLADIESGIGVISGYLETGVACENDISISNQIVKLFDSNNKYIAFDYTNDNGEFEFSSLSNGSYSLQGEVTGNSSTSEFVELSAANPFSDENMLVIDCNSFVGIEDFTIASEIIEVKEVFPMPASEFVNLRIQSNSNEKIEVDIIDQIGRIYVNQAINISSGESLIELNLSNLQTGLFIFRIKSSEGQILHTGKIIITN